MMKVWTITLGLTALIFLLNFAGEGFLNRAAQSSREVLQEIREDAQAGNWEKAKSGCKTAMLLWKKSMPLLQMLLDHIEIENLDMLFAKTRTLCEQKQKEELFLNLAELERSFYHIEERYAFHWRNIF